MTVRKRGSGYQANFTHKGERHIRQFNTEDAAKAWELEARAALLKGGTLPDNKHTPNIGGSDVGTVQNVFRRVVQYHWQRLKNSKGTIRNAAYFIRWVGGNTSIHDAFSQQNIDAFVKHLIDDRRVANATINRYMAAVSRMIKACDDSLVRRPKLPSFKESVSRVAFFSDEDEVMILQTLTLWGKEREKDFFIFLIDTGARPFTEGTQFTWQDVTERTVTFWETKTNKPRTVPLTRRAYQAVINQKKYEEASIYPFNGVSDKNWVYLWSRLRSHIPQIADTVLYTARHTCCTRLVQRGIDLVRVQVWMGHSNISTTMRYAHHSPTHLLDAVKVLERDTGNVTVA